MSRTAFRQADIERLIKAAKKQGADLQFDMRTFIATVIPAIHNPKPVDPIQGRPRILPLGQFAPDGKEHFDED